MKINKGNLLDIIWGNKIRTIFLGTILLLNIIGHLFGISYFNNAAEADGMNTSSHNYHHK